MKKELELTFKKMMKTLKSLILLVSVGFFILSCSDNTTYTVSGTVSKGPVANADVTVFAYNSDGTRGQVLVTTNSAEDGTFSVEVNHMGAVEIVVTGGSYMDEATGETVNLTSGRELRSIAILNGDLNVGVTALTTIAASYIDENAADGLQTAINAASSGVVNAFGLSNIGNINDKIPVDISVPVAIESIEDLSTVQVAAVQAGLSQIVETEGQVPESVLTLIEDIAADFADGNINGMDGNQALQFAQGITPEEAVSGLTTAMDSFLNSADNKSGLVLSDIFGG